MPAIAMEAVRAAVLGGIEMVEIPDLLNRQVLDVLLRATACQEPGGALRDLKLARLGELRRLLAEEEARWFDYPERSGRLEWMVEMLDEFIAENIEPADDPRAVPALR